MNARPPETTDLLDRLRNEIERLRDDCAQFYQVIGYLAHYAKLSDDPQTVKALDNALAAADGDSRPHDDLLPFTANVRNDNHA